MLTPLAPVSTPRTEDGLVMAALGARPRLVGVIAEKFMPDVKYTGRTGAAGGGS